MIDGQAVVVCHCRRQERHWRQCVHVQRVVMHYATSMLQLSMANERHVCNESRAMSLCVPRVPLLVAAQSNGCVNFRGALLGLTDMLATALYRLMLSSSSSAFARL